MTERRPEIDDFDELASIDSQEELNAVSVKQEVPTPSMDESCIGNETARRMAPQDRH